MKPAISGKKMSELLNLILKCVMPSVKSEKKISLRLTGKKPAVAGK